MTTPAGTMFLGSAKLSSLTPQMARSTDAAYFQRSSAVGKRGECFQR